MKGLNDTESRNRFRFQNLAERLKKINVDVVHRIGAKIHENSHVAMDVSSGIQKCNFQEELEQCKSLYGTSPFKRFYYDIWDYVQSQAEVVHHLPKIIEKLLLALKVFDIIDKPTILLLFSALCRDACDDIYPHLKIIMHGLIEQIDAFAHDASKGGAPTPELCGKLFECMSNIIKDQKCLLTDYDVLREFYGPTLGNHTAFVREYASSTFGIILRKLSTSKLLKHVSKVLRATCNAKMFVGALTGDANILDYVVDLSRSSKQHAIKNGDVDRNTDDVELAVLPKRICDLLDGLSWLVFNTLKGVKGHGHSQLKDRCIAFGNQCVWSESDDLATSLRYLYCFGYVFALAIKKLAYHLHFDNMIEFWESIMVFFSTFKKNYNELCSGNIYNAKMCKDAHYISIVNVPWLFSLEIMIYLIQDAGGRSLFGVRKSQLKSKIGTNSLELCKLVLTSQFSHEIHPSVRIKAQELLYSLLKNFEVADFDSQQLNSLLASLISSATIDSVRMVTKSMLALLHSDSRNDLDFVGLIKRYIVTCSAQLSKGADNSDLWVWISFLYNFFVQLYDSRRNLLVHSEERRKNETPWLSSKNMKHSSLQLLLTLFADNYADLAGIINFCVNFLVTFETDEVKSDSKGKSKLGLANKSLGISQLCEGDDYYTYMMAVSFVSLICKLSSIKEMRSVIGKVLKDNLNEKIQKSCVIIVSKVAEWNISKSQFRKLSIMSNTFSLLSSLIGLSACDGLIDLDMNSCKAIGRMFCAHALNTKSICLLNSILEFVDVYQYFCITNNIHFSNIMDELFGSSVADKIFAYLVKCLDCSSYWIRLVSLAILRYFPTFTPIQLSDNRASIDIEDMENMDIDFTDDKQIKSESFDVVQICSYIASLPIGLDTEREFSRLFTNLGVVLRTNKLPVNFCELCLRFCFGCLQVKFKALWDPALTVIVSALEESNKLDLKDDENETVNILFEQLLKTLIEGNESLATSESFSLYENCLPGCLFAEDSINLQADSGNIPLLGEVVASDKFYFSIQSNLKVKSSSVTVSPDARADNEGVYGSVWGILKKCPFIILQKSKIVVPIFFKFLQDQYYQSFYDDSEIPMLQMVRVLDSKWSNLNVLNGQSLPTLPLWVLKKRLSLYLEIFASVHNPKQLYEHKLLYQYYLVLLGKSDISVISRAVDCLLTYKPAFLLPYKDNIKAILNEKTVRGELLSFDLSAESSVILTEHRTEFIPIIMSIGYGLLTSRSKDSSKSARDQISARRNAVMNFLAKCEVGEIPYLYSLMVRGVIPLTQLLESVTCSQGSVKCMEIAKNDDFYTQGIHQIFEKWYEIIVNVITEKRTIDGVSAKDDKADVNLKIVSPERIIGFLHLLELNVKVFGVKFQNLLPITMQLIITILKNQEIISNLRDISQALAIEEEENEIEEVEEHERSNFNSSVDNVVKVRNLCFARISDYISKFYRYIDTDQIVLNEVVYNATSLTSGLWSIITPMLSSFPSSIFSSTKPPALLKLLHAFVVPSASQLRLSESRPSNNATCLNCVISRNDIILSLVRCLAMPSNYNVFSMVLEILLIIFENLDSDSIASYAELLIHCYTARFLGLKLNEVAELKIASIASVKISASGNSKGELKLLCLVANHFSKSVKEKKHHSSSINLIAIGNLSIILLAMLRSYTNSPKFKIQEHWVLDIMSTYTALVPIVDDVSLHVGFVSRLFGPTAHSFSLFNSWNVRSSLVNVLFALSNHKSTLGLLNTSAIMMRELISQDGEVIGSRDYERCMPIFNDLAGGVAAGGVYSWEKVFNVDNHDFLNKSIAFCTSIVHECVRCLYESDLVLRSAAVACLKVFSTCVFKWETSRYKKKPTCTVCWFDLLTGIVLSEIHKGLKLATGGITDQVLKGFVELVSHVSKLCVDFKDTKVYKNASSEDRKVMDRSLVHLHFDLAILTHSDIDQDFFQNMTHIQFHRRFRAMNKLSQNFAKWSKQELTSSETYLDENIDDIECSDDLEVNLPSVHTCNKNPFSLSTLTNILLPLAYFPLLSGDFHKKEFVPYKTEAAVLIGQICRFLPWSQYYFQIKRILRELDKIKKKRSKIRIVASDAGENNSRFRKRNGNRGNDTNEVVVLADRERFLIMALCVVLDSFHFSETSQCNFDESDVDTDMDNKIETNVDVEEDESILSENESESEDDIDKSELDETSNVKTESEEKKPLAVAGNSIFQVAIKSIYPWVKSFLVKEEKDHEGNKANVVRPTVAVALSNLIAKIVPGKCDDSSPHVSAGSENQRRGLFVALVIMVVDTLRNKDSGARDAARIALARMILAMGIDSMCGVLYELNQALKEGYQRHVRAYTVRYILTEVLKQYTIPEVYYSGNYELQQVDLSEKLEKLELKDTEELKGLVLTPFDECIPLIMDTAMDDLLGAAHEDRSAEDVSRNLIREAKGVKAYEILEETAQKLLFRPASTLLAISNSPAICQFLENNSVAPETLSSVHLMLNPIVSVLMRSPNQEFQRNQTLSSTVINRISEALQRISSGLSKNASLVSKELLIYVYATLLQCVQKLTDKFRDQQIAMGKIELVKRVERNNVKVIEEDEDNLLDNLPSYLLDGDSDDEGRLKLGFRGEIPEDDSKGKSNVKDDVTGFKARVWLPGDRNGGKAKGEDSKASLRAALQARDSDKAASTKVYDGASAPKLTGFDRHLQSSARKKAANGALASDDEDTITICTLAKFCLTILNSCFKLNKISETDPNTLFMLKPFLPLLGHCLCLPGTTMIAPLATRCLCVLLSWGLDFQIDSNSTGAGESSVFMRAIATKMVKMMFRSGTLLSTDSELVQSCLRGLASMFQLWKKNNNSSDKTSGHSEFEIANKLSQDEIKKSLPLKESTIRLLLQLINSTMLEVTSSHQSAAFQLLRVVIDTRLLLPEIYDIVSTLSEQIVLSHRHGIRASAIAIVVSFIIKYPLGDKRLASHISQLLKNCEFEFEEGRVAAIEMIGAIVKYLPIPLLAEYAQIMFFSLSLRLANEKSETCSRLLSSVLSNIFCRLDAELVLPYIDFAIVWLSSMKNYYDECEENGLLNFELKETVIQNDSDDSDEEMTVSDGPALFLPVNDSEKSRSACGLLKTGSLVLSTLIAARPEIFKKKNIFESIIPVIMCSLSIMVSQAELQRQLNQIKLISNVENDSSTSSVKTEGFAISRDQFGEIFVNNSISEVVGPNRSVVTTSDVDENLTICGGVVSSLLTLTLKLYSFAASGADQAVNVSKMDHRYTFGRLKDSNGDHFMEIVQECMLDFSNEEVRGNAVSLIAFYLSRRQTGKSDPSLFLLSPNNIFNLCRRLCLVLQLQSTLSGYDLEVKQASTVKTATPVGNKALVGTVCESKHTNVLTNISNCLIFIISSLCDPKKSAKKPDLLEVTHSQDEEKFDELDDIFNSLNEHDSDVDGDDDEIDMKDHGIKWLMLRLRKIGIDNRGSRRFDIISVLEQILLSNVRSVVLDQFLEVVLEVAVRASISCHPKDGSYGDISSLIPEKKILIQLTYEKSVEFLGLIEKSASPALYISALSTVKEKIRVSQTARKQKQTRDAIINPEMYATRKVDKSKRKQEQRKRKLNSFVAAKGKRQRF